MAHLDNEFPHQIFLILKKNGQYEVAFTDPAPFMEYNSNWVSFKPYILKGN
jgi:hypothetical protein